MIDLVTIEQAYAHLRIDWDSDGSADDPWLEVFIPAISQAIALWVKNEARLYIPELDSSGNPVLDSDGNPVPELDSNGEQTPLPIVRAAVLIELERQYRSRGGEDETFMEDFSQAGYGYVLGRGSTALLTPLRKPTVA